MIFLLWAAGIVGILFGLVLMVSPGFIKKFSNYCDEVILSVDSNLNPYRLIVGVLLLLAAAWSVYIIRIADFDLFFYPILVLALLFGVLYLLLPNWLANFSNWANKHVFTTDVYILSASKIIGLAFLILGVYIIYIACCL